MSLLPKIGVFIMAAPSKVRRLGEAGLDLAATRQRFHWAWTHGSAGSGFRLGASTSSNSWRRVRPNWRRIRVSLRSVRHSAIPALSSARLCEHVSHRRPRHSRQTGNLSHRKATLPVHSHHFAQCTHICPPRRHLILQAAQQPEGCGMCSPMAATRAKNCGMR